MSQQHQQQPQQKQQQPQQPDKAVPKWEPSERTIFLIQMDDQFLKRARERLESEWYPMKARATQQLNTSRLRPDTEIVVVYMDPDAPIIEADGKRRPRRGPKRVKGVTEEPAELPEVKLSAPVMCGDMWQEGGEDEDGFGTGGGGVQLRNTYDERTGRDRFGLISKLTAACFGETARGRNRATIRVAYRPDLNEITVRAT